ncbi:MAG: hypothetical protein AAGL24_05825 [Pseudomonadota bacterium]
MRMMETNRWTRVTLFVAAGLALAGCAAQSEGPKPTIRSSLETAPADLQLLCASEAATRFNLDSTRVLPVNSAPTGDGAFRVGLTTPNGPLNCDISSDGTIAAIEAAPPATAS